MEEQAAFQKRMTVGLARRADRLIANGVILHRKESFGGRRPEFRKETRGKKSTVSGQQEERLERTRHTHNHFASSFASLRLCARTRRRGQGIGDRRQRA